MVSIVSFFRADLISSISCLRTSTVWQSLKRSGSEFFKLVHLQGFGCGEQQEFAGQHVERDPLNLDVQHELVREAASLGGKYFVFIFEFLFSSKIFNLAPCILIVLFKSSISESSIVSLVLALSSSCIRKDISASSGVLESNGVLVFVRFLVLSIDGGAVTRPVAR